MCVILWGRGDDVNACSRDETHGHPSTHTSLHDGTERRGEVGEGGGPERGQGRLPDVGRDAPQGRRAPPPLLRQGVRGWILELDGGFWF